MVNNLVGYRIMCCNFVFQKLKSSFILCVCTCVCKCVGMFVNVCGAQRLMLDAFALNRKTPNEAKLTGHQAPGLTLSLPAQHMLSCQGFHMDTECLNSCPHAPMENALPTDIFPAAPLIPYF